MLSLAACVVSGLVSHSAIGASGNWTGLTDDTWAGANWSATPVPGAADTATFNGAGNGNTNIDLGSGVTIQNILFNTANAAAYNIGIGALGNQTLTLNFNGSIAVSSTVANNQTFDAGLVLGTNASAGTYNLTNNSPSTLDLAGNISGGATGGTAGTETLAVGGAGNTVIGGSLLNGGAGQTLALTKVGTGTLTFSGTTNAALIGSGAGGGAFGAVTVNGGALVLDYSNYNAVGNANLLNSYTPVSLGGAALQMIGNVTNASTQSFNNGSGVTVNPGLNTISVGPNGGNINNPLPTLNLGGFTQNLGSQTVFYGPAYYNSASGATSVTVPATGTITTSTAGLQNKLLWPGGRTAIATVGLYNWASVTTVAGTNNILSGDQVSGFYSQIAAGGTVAAADTNYDLLGNATASNTATWYADTLRFNVPGAFSFTTQPGGTNHAALIGGILVTPNVGANNTNINNGGTWLAAINNVSATSALDIYQNNTAGELLINVPMYYLSSNARAISYVQGGPGTVVLSGSGTSTANIGAPYLNGGDTVINADTQIGSAAAAATLYLNGGTLVASGNMNLGNGATANPRPVSLLGNGGGLAAVAGTTMIVDGQIGSANTAGTLVIGIPASSANGNVAGLLPGTGSVANGQTLNTANATPVYATGTVALTYANGTNGNYQYSPTLITSGATLQINSQYDLGGVNASSVTFNNGTLQYSATLATGVAGLATDISAQPVIFAGNATIDTNGHAISYANSIGGGGAGLLTVKDSVGTGSLTLAGNNTYTGGTIVLSGTLNVTNTTGSATGPGPVNLSGGTLSGTGIIAGTVNASGGAITPGAAGTKLTLNGLNYTSGNLNFSINGSAGTASQISATSVSFNATPTFGPLSLAGALGLTNNEVFSVLTSSSAFSGISYLSSLPSQTSGRFIFTPSVSNGGKSIIFTATGYEANLVWQGGITGLGTGTQSKGDGTTWNDKQTTGASNFYNPNSSVNGYDFFYDLDNVTFNDSVVSPGAGSLGHLVNLTSTVSPSTVTVATAGNYTFVGTGAITGLGSVLVSSGSLILENAQNSYSGGTNISSGALLLPSVANVLPTTGNVTVAGTLDLGGFNQSIGGLADAGVSSGIVQSTGAAATLTTNASGSPVFSGTLRNGTNTLSLITSGTGTQILTGSNSYTGGTTINAGSTLQIGNNTSIVSLPSGQPVNDNGSLVFNFSTGTTSVNSNISGSGTVTQSGPAGSVLQLNTSNTYSGGTIIKSATIQFTGNTGVGTGDVTVAGGALLDLNGNSPTLGALNGAGIIDSTAAGTMVLTIGNNNDGGAFSGTIQNSNGAINLVKAGSGTQVLSGVNNYTGSTTINGGTLSISTGSLGTSASSTGAIYVNTATLNISGNVYATSLSTYNTAGFSGVNLTAGSVTLSGNLGVNQDTNGASNAALVSLTGGTLSANSVTIDRSSSNYGGNIQTLGSTGTGLYVNGANLVIATTLTFGDLGTQSFSSADMRIDSGSVTVGGTTIITDNNTRLSLLDINGGTFTSNDTTGAGVQVGGLYANGYGELLVSGNGTLKTHMITMGDSNQTGGLNILELIGGTTYIGSGGIVQGGGSTNTINLGNTTVATTPIIAATGSWSSSLNMTLNNSSTGSHAIFQAANASGGAENITLTGTIFGNGGLAKTGTGYLALAGGASYLGSTNVSAGTLVDVNNNVLQYSSSVNINGSMIIQNAPSLQSFTNAVGQGYSGGAWNGSGSGVISSTAAAADPNHLHALGVIQNDNGSGSPLYSTFEGYSSLNDSDVLVKYTWYGDTDLNGKVDGTDYSRIDYAYANNLTSASPLTGWFNGDFNYDGVINGSDYTLMDNAFNQQGAVIAAQLASATAQVAGGSAVPEPTSLGLLGMGAVGLLGRRKRPRQIIARNG